MDAVDHAATDVVASLADTLQACETLLHVVAGRPPVSSSLLHEVVPLTRGRRFGVFTFLSASGSLP